MEERAIVPVSAAEKWQLKCGCSCWARITTIAEWTKMGERAIVPVSDAKLLGPVLSTIFFLKALERKNTTKTVVVKQN